MRAQKYAPSIFSDCRGQSDAHVPTFVALVAAEEELGPLFALIDRASGGGLKLAELVALFWHCIEAQEEERPTRETVGEAVAAQGLANVTPQLRLLLEAVLKGG